MAKIKIWLLANPLTEDANDYSARVSSAGTLDLELLVKGIVAKRSEYQEVTIRSVADLLFNEMSESIKAGFAVHTPLFRAYPAVTGAFYGRTAKFNADEHKLKVNFTVNGAFMADLRKSKVEVLGISDGQGVIGKVIDSRTGIEDHSITPNDIIHIGGSKIKIQGEAAEIGVYLIKQSDGSRIKLQRIVENMPSELIALLPALEVDDYELEILTQYSGGGRPVKDIRTLTFDHLLTVLA